MLFLLQASRIVARGSGRRIQRLAESANRCLLLVPARLVEQFAFMRATKVITFLLEICCKNQVVDHLPQRVFVATAQLRTETIVLEEFCVMLLADVVAKFHE